MENYSVIKYYNYSDSILKRTSIKAPGIYDDKNEGCLAYVFDTSPERDKKFNELKISQELNEAHKIIGDALENLQMYAMIVQNSPHQQQLPTIMLALQELDKFLVDNFTKTDEYTFKLSNFNLDDENAMSLHFAGVDTHITFDSVADTLKDEVVKLYHNHTMALKQAKQVVLSNEAIKILIRDNFVDDEPEQ